MHVIDILTAKPRTRKRRHVAHTLLFWHNLLSTCIDDRRSGTFPTYGCAARRSFHPVERIAFAELPAMRPRTARSGRRRAFWRGDSRSLSRQRNSDGRLPGDRRARYRLRGGISSERAVPVDRTFGRQNDFASRL